jgi:hypothetical protein
MKNLENQAARRLFKKLSALRATLSNEERAILDNIVGVDEVSAHKFTTKAMGKVAAKTAGKADEVAAHKLTTKSIGKVATKTAGKANEVIAHKINTKATGKIATKTAGKANEVVAHKISERAAGKSDAKITGKAAGRSTFRIAFDPNSEEYKIQE